MNFPTFYSFLARVDHLLGRYSFERTELDAQKDVFLRLSIHFGAFALLLLTFFGWFTLHDPYTTGVKLGFGLIFVLLSILYRRIPDHILTFLICATYAAFSLAYLSSERHGSYVLYWLVFVPLFYIALLGRHRGTLYSLLFLLALVIHAIYGITTGKFPWWDPTRANSFAFAMALLIATAYFTTFFFERAQKRLHTLSVTDPLTRLYNRRHIDQFLRTRLYTLTHNSTDGSPIPFCLAILDLDHFKHINDTHGHLHGDRVLKQMSHLLLHNLRSTDIVGRWGGEEFILLFPNTDCDTALATLERLRETVANTHFPPAGRLTISAGLACSTHTPLESLVEQADRALYQAKYSGRNRTCSDSQARLPAIPRPQNQADE